MKRLLVIGGLMVLGVALASPAWAGHRGIARGHGRSVAGHSHHAVVLHHHHHRFSPWPTAHFAIGLGFPGDLFYYAPAPVYYGSPVLYGPPPCARWVPAHYVWDGGVRFWIEGHWSR